MGLRNSFVERATPTLADAVARSFPGGRLVRVEPLDADCASADATAKGSGYGLPLRLFVESARGERKVLVFHTASANVFGHDRRSDRAAEMLLGYDTFNGIPRHVRALDVGAIRTTGELASLSDAGEFYLLTEYADGDVYASDLRRIARDGSLGPRDVERARALALYLAELHRTRAGGPLEYRKSVRDLVGSGEGVAGIIDGYPDGVPGAPLARLERIQAACGRFRWKLRNFEHRCRLIHGDFHPFNVVFGEDDELALLDASRGSRGDPADDVTCMAVNYVFFGLEHPEAWRGAFSLLWKEFWSTHLGASEDSELLRVAAPFLAWRGLVVANPVWYPAVTERARDGVLGFVESVLDRDSFDPESAGSLFR